VVVVVAAVDAMMMLGLLDVDVMMCLMMCVDDSGGRMEERGGKGGLDEEG
jgi:hypothetical protein